jgi:hypothetical protein
MLKQPAAIRNLIASPLVLISTALDTAHVPDHRDVLASARAIHVDADFATCNIADVLARVARDDGEGVITANVTLPVSTRQANVGAIRMGT